nr:hypothetical protein [Tanacetum cinerariifolium]
MADNRTMEELLQAPTEGYGEANIIPEINADHFEIKTNLLQLVQANPYHGFERENPHTYIKIFKMITSTLKFRDVPNDVIKLMMFPYSLEGSARVWENASKSDDRIDKLADQISTLVDIFAKKVVTPALVKANQSLTSGTLLSNTIPNSKGEMKAITTRSGVAYEGPLIPTNTSPKKSFLTNEDKLFELAKIPLNQNCSAMILKKLPKKLGDPGKFLIPCDFLVVDFEADPHVPLILGRSFSRIGRALIDVYREEITLRVNNKVVTFNLNQTTRYSSTYDDFSQGEIAKAKSLLEEPPELELKDLSSHLEYAYLEGVDKLPVIIAKDLKVDKKEALLKVLKSHKRAFAWKFIDIKGIDPWLCTHKILTEEDYKPVVQSQIRVNPKMHEVIKKEVIKLLDAKIIYPISDSS